MNPKRLEEMLSSVATGKLGVDEAMKSLRDLPFEDLGFAKIDHHRALRRGFPEVIYGAGKSPEQIATIAERLSEKQTLVLVTKTDASVFEALRKRHPEAKWDAEARTIVLNNASPLTCEGRVLVLCAGTSDIPIAQEAALTAGLMGLDVERSFDVGVAGLQRVLAERERLAQADVVVVVAGMDGALPSVVSGLVSVPLVAVPTSVGYGASFGGLAALLTMLNACSPGIAVVNIDNGFGAGYFAGLIASRRPR